MSVDNSLGKEFILNSQTAWRKARKNPLQVKSQAIEIPKFIADRLQNLLIDALPNYIPDQLRNKLRSNHPAPIIGFSAYQDPRILSTPSTIESLSRFPENLQTDQERTNWLLGIRLLDEYATESMNIDILQSGMNIMTQVLSPLLPVRYLDFVIRGMIASSFYRPIFQIVEILEPQPRGYHRFKASLCLSALSGDSTEVDRTLTRHSIAGIDSLESLALFIGDTAYNQSRTNLPKNYNKIQMHGIHSHEFPGVINCISALAIEGLLQLLPHEMIHYLASDQHHLGLLPVQY